MESHERGSPVKTEHVEPHQLGWLRRPELDYDKVEVWERPDGKLFAHRVGTRLYFVVYKGPVDE